MTPVYTVNNTITGKSVVVEFTGEYWRVVLQTMTFQFFSFASAKRGARTVAGMRG